MGLGGEDRSWGGGSAPSPEVMPTLRAVELSHSPHLVTRHRLIALPALSAPGHLRGVDKGAGWTSQVRTGSLLSARVGIFTPQELANATNLDFLSSSPKKSWL